MGLADRINSSKDLLAEQPKPTCGVSLLIALMDGVDRASFIEALGNDSYLGTRLTEMLNEWGDEIAEEVEQASEGDRPRLEQLASLCRKIRPETIQRHRRGACGCRRKGE